MQRNIRKEKAQETLRICENGNYTINNKEISIGEAVDKMKKATVYFSHEQLKDLVGAVKITAAYTTDIEVTGEDSVSCIHRIAKDEGALMCLNFASAKNPGGGFLNGAIAQEESLALSSALYSSQLEVPNFYKTHRGMKSCVYTDGMILSPNVPVFRNHDGDLVPYSTCTFITSAAVNTGVVKQREPEKETAIPALMLQRMDKLMTLCVHQKIDTLILGAWGCGVFQNDPQMIAELFHKQLEGKYKGVFKKVVFAVYANNVKFITPFKEVFGA